MDSQLDRLDAIAERVAIAKDPLKETNIGVLSTGERLYVALAASRQDVLDAYGYTIAEALARIDTGWTAELVRRWQYRDDPRKAS